MSEPEPGTVVFVVEATADAEVIKAADLIEES